MLPALNQFDYETLGQVIDGPTKDPLFKAFAVPGNHARFTLQTSEGKLTANVSFHGIVHDELEADIWRLEGRLKRLELEDRLVRGDEQPLVVVDYSPKSHKGQLYRVIPPLLDSDSMVREILTYSSKARAMASYRRRIFTGLILCASTDEYPSMDEKPHVCLSQDGIQRAVDQLLKTGQGFHTGVDDALPLWWSLGKEK